MDVGKEENLYRIGTVASLTGISVERLRAWERRYDLSPAHKAGKTRFYSAPQLERLKKIKRLIDQGHPISSLAALDDTQLEARIDTETSDPVIVSLQAPTVGLVGPNLLTLEQQALRAETRSRIEVVSRWANIDAFFTEQTATDDPQVLIFQLPVLSSQTIEKVKKLYPSAKLIAVYQFATAQLVSDIQASGTPTLKWPLSWSELEHTAISERGLPPRAGAPRRYSDEELIAIAAQSEDPTNCPAYLIEAIHQLNAFATYADECSQAVESPPLYQRVSSDASQARAQLELALETLIGGSDSE